MRLVGLLIFILVATLGCEAPTPPPSAPKPAPAASEGGMCLEHGVPEALCTKCNPALAQVFKAKGDWCPEHGFPESFCPICNPDVEFPNVDGPKSAAPTNELSSIGSIEARVVRLKSADIEEAAQIKTVKAVEAESGSSIECSAQLSFDANQVADVRAIVPGIVREVEVEIGQNVKAGDRLFVLESTQIGETQGRLQSAQERVRTAEANLARKKSLFASNVSSKRDVEVAEQELAEARAAVRSSSATLRMAGASRGQPSGRYTLKAPIDGQVVRRPAVVGALATGDASLALIANTATMWAMCDIPERDAGLVRVGHQMVLDLGTESVQGAITWLSPEVDPRTRMVSARAEIPNPDGLLRANQFAVARVVTGALQKSVMVPREAVQRVEGRQVVFVRASAGTYIPRVVDRFGDGDLVAVAGKVEPGDDIVVDGAVLLRTEVMPGSIGAGCCEPGAGEE